jgi:ABC-type antimicrobial peptide transport system permease subunit
VPYGHADQKLGEHAAFMEIVVRMQPGARPNVPSLRAALRGEFPLVTVSAGEATELLDPWMRQPKFQAYLFGSFAVAGLLLAAIGLYAVASFDVSLRKYEMGVRLTLGARPAQLHWAVMKASLVPVAAGVGAGLLGAWWAAQFLQAYLTDVRARDPLWTAVAAAMLIAAAASAASFPARRAARMNPTVVLRTH